MSIVAGSPVHSRSELRQAILAVSERIGREQGEAALTMRNIAAALGVSPTLLYQHFESKAAILRELEAQGHAELERRLDAALSPSVDPPERMRALCRAYVEFARRSPWLYSLLFASASAQEHAEPFASRAAACIVAVGGGSDDAPLLAGLHAWAAVHGLALAQQAGAAGSGEDRERFVEAYLSRLLVAFLG
jgi:AcrR family transcriptional regulator